MLPIITISKETGTNGKKIAELVAQKLNIPVIDKHLVEETRERTGLSPFESERKGEFLTQYDFFTNVGFNGNMYAGDDQSGMYHIQHQIIMEEIKNGPCIIVGRCADAILEEEGIPSLSVFVYADAENCKSSANYDLALNINAFGEELCAELIAATARKYEKNQAA